LYQNQFLVKAATVDFDFIRFADRREARLNRFLKGILNVDWA
jgi:hypothetical protein